MADDTDVREVGIEGLLLQPLKIIDAEGGPVLRMVRPDSSLMPKFPHGFGEIYFSEVYPGKVKAWKRHKVQNQLFAVPMGEIKIAFYDGRPDSKTWQVLVVLALGRPNNYNLLRIPAGVWYGFEALGERSALICNLADIPHDPEECERLPRENDQIPFRF